MFEKYPYLIGIGKEGLEKFQHDLTQTSFNKHAETTTAHLAPKTSTQIADFSFIGLNDAQDKALFVVTDSQATQTLFDMPMQAVMNSLGIGVSEDKFRVVVRAIDERPNSRLHPVFKEALDAAMAAFIDITKPQVNGTQPALVRL